MNLPLEAIVFVAFNTLALTLALLVFGVLLLWRHPTGLMRLALAVFMAANSVLLAINILLHVQVYRAPTDPSLALFVYLLVDTFALANVLAFILVIVSANVLANAFAILIRAGLVLWLLFQIPLWRGELLTITVIGTELRITASGLPTLFPLLCILAYQMMTFWLAYHHKRIIRHRWIIGGVLLLQAGRVIVLAVPGLREATLQPLVMTPAVILIGYGLVQTGLLVPLAIRNSQIVTLRKNARNLTQLESPLDAPEWLAEQARALFQADAAVLYRSTSEPQETWAIQTGATTSWQKFFAQQQNLFDDMIATGKPAQINALPNLPAANNHGLGKKSLAAMGVPIIVGEHISGELFVMTIERDPFTEVDRALLELLVAQYTCQLNLNTVNSDRPIANVKIIT